MRLSEYGCTIESDGQIVAWDQVFDEKPWTIRFRVNGTLVAQLEVAEERLKGINYKNHKFTDDKLYRWEVWVPGNKHVRALDTFRMTPVQGDFRAWLIPKVMDCWPKHHSEYHLAMKFAGVMREECYEVTGLRLDD